MSENLPQKYKENFFSKFLRKIKMFFIKDKYKNDFIPSNTTTVENIQNTRNNMLQDIKVDIDFSNNTDYEKKKFMDNLTNRPELLENFSNDRLEKILQYYLNENEKKTHLLNKISA